MNTVAVYFYTADAYELDFARLMWSHQFPLQSLILEQSMGLDSSLKKLDYRKHLSQKQIYLNMNSK